ncbi:peptidyl-prolyl cis-trans isomerase FKBP42-like [Pyrus communis]|uniref:peptidyl-prolyl cis-trans isomerase FKBP42-like n=1 Tax=Pyrus communis TaxID=23211 RepID=UPI0035C26F28
MEDVREQAEQESQDGENETVTEDGTFVRGEPSEDANGPPKVDSKVEILHEKVTKQIIKEGHGQIPSKYSTCFLPYRAWTESTGHKFEDTWDEQRPLEIILGKGISLAE